MKLHLWFVRFIGVLVPRRFRADWRQEWEAELRYRETMLARWDSLNWRSKLDLLWHSLGAFWDALWLQPQRWVEKMRTTQPLAFMALCRTPSHNAHERSECGWRSARKRVRPATCPRGRHQEWTH